MGYIGAVGPAYDPTRATVPQLDAERFNGNNSTVAFTLLRQVLSPTDVEVFVENVRQEPIVAYSIVNSNILTFTEAPQTGTNNIYVVYRNSGVSNYAFVPDGSISFAKLTQNIRQFNVDNFTANGTGQTFTLSETPATANTVMVAIDGVIQTAPSNYSISGTTLTFTSAPPSSANVTVRHLGFRTTATVTALSAGSVTATELAAGSVTNAKLAGSITSDKISTVNGASLIANTIPVNTVSGNVIVANTVSNSAFATGAIENYLRANTLDFGMRNRIINGAMRIDQRNAGAAVTPASGDYTLDRWQSVASQSAKYSVQQDSSANTVAGFTSSLKVTSLSAYTVGSSELFNVLQNIEGFNVADLRWGTANARPVTLSFWVRSSLIGTFGGAFNNGGTRSYPFSYTISVADTWEQKIITVPGDTSGTWGSTNSNGIQIWFSLGCGSTQSGTAGVWSGSNFVSATGATSVVGTNNATWYITGVQLEEGSVPTPFEYRPYGTEVNLCYRYYYRLVVNPLDPICTAAGYNSSITFGVVPFPVTMRTAPDIDQSSLASQFSMAGGGTSQLFTSFAYNERGTNTITLYNANNLSVTTGYGYWFRSNSGAGTGQRLAFTAEL